MLNTKRVRWMIQSIADSYNIEEKNVEDSLKQHKNQKILEDFLSGAAAPKIFIHFQSLFGTDGLKQKEIPLDYYLQVSYGEDETLKEKAIYFYRTTANGQCVNVDEAYDQDVMFGEISTKTITQLDGVMTHIYEPLINGLEDQDWGECKEEQREEFLKASKKFAAELEVTLKSLNYGFVITKFSHEEFEQLETEREKSEFLQKHFLNWLEEIERHLEEDIDPKKETLEPGKIY